MRTVRLLIVSGSPGNWYSGVELTSVMGVYYLVHGCTNIKDEIRVCEMTISEIGRGGSGYKRQHKSQEQNIKMCCSVIGRTRSFGGPATGLIPHGVVFA